MKYLFIDQHKKTWPINLICRLFKVKRNGYYSYHLRKLNKPENPAHWEMLDWIKKIAKASNDCYGSRRMKKALNAQGYEVSRNKARKLMSEAGVQVRHRRKYKVTTNSKHNLPVLENLLNQQFTVEKPEQVYVSDITYIWTQEGWLYLAVVIDLFSRKVVGWSMSSRMKATLVCDALKMAIWQRKPEPGLIVHSDRGSQYASQVYQRLLKENGYIGSMSQKGNCWDNAVAESFFGSLKQERVQWQHYQARSEAQQDILNYIVMFYNNYRLHSSIGYSSPNQYELEMERFKKVA